MFIEGVLTIASASNSRRDIGLAADGGQGTIEARAVIAREHWVGVRSGAGAIAEHDTGIGSAEGRRCHTAALTLD